MTRYIYGISVRGGQLSCIRSNSTERGKQMLLDKTLTSLHSHTRCSGKCMWAMNSPKPRQLARNTVLIFITGLQMFYLWCSLRYHQSHQAVPSVLQKDYSHHITDRPAYTGPSLSRSICYQEDTFNQFNLDGGAVLIGWGQLHCPASDTFSPDLINPRRRIWLLEALCSVSAGDTICFVRHLPLPPPQAVSADCPGY